MFDANFADIEKKCEKDTEKYAQEFNFNTSFDFRYKILLYNSCFHVRNL